MLTKLDYKKQDKQLYQPTATEVTIVDVPQMQFLMIDGQGDPNGEKFQLAIEALYALAYGIKMLPKKEAAPKSYFEYVVPPLEGLWWPKEGEWNMENRSTWLWTAMIRQPEFVNQELLEHVQQIVRKKKKDITKLDSVRLADFEEGLSAHIMHIGPFSEEGLTVQRIFDYVEKNKYKLRGKHHEIYLSDYRKVDPVKMKTVIRHPIESS